MTRCHYMKSWLGHSNTHLDVYRDSYMNVRVCGDVASDIDARFARLVAAGGNRLDDPAGAARRVADDEFARVRLAMFRAMGDPTRFLIMALLRAHGAIATTELEKALGLASSTVSHHLRILETARLIIPEQLEGWTFWHLAAWPTIEAV